MSDRNQSDAYIKVFRGERADVSTACIYIYMKILATFLLDANDYGEGKA